MNSKFETKIDLDLFLDKNITLDVNSSFKKINNNNTSLTINEVKKNYTELCQIIMSSLKAINFLKDGIPSR